MSRRARIVLPGYPYHLTQRGNNKQRVFLDDQDMEKYLSLFDQYAEENGFKTWAYCLMPNHVHLVGVPEREDTLATVFRNTNTRYSRYFNIKHGQGGHLWHCRFYSCPLDDAHAYTAVRYVETNPVRAGLVDQAEHYLWSSAQAHVDRKSHPLLAKDCWLVSRIDDWRDYLAEPGEQDRLREVRRCTRSCRPAGGSVFLEAIAKAAGVSFESKPVGRPPRQQD